MLTIAEGSSDVFPAVLNTDLLGLSEDRFVEAVLREPRQSLGQLSSQLSRFTKAPGKMSLLYTVMERIKWVELEEGPDFDAFRDLLLHLSTLVPSSFPTIFKSILLGAVCSQEATALSKEQIDRALDLISQITALVPSSTTVLMASLEYNFPHYSRSHIQLVNYVTFLVALAKKIGYLKAKILELVVEKLLTIDVAIQMEAVNLPSDEVDQGTNADSDEELEVIDSDLLRRSSSPVALNMVDLMNKLDSLLAIVFQYFADLSRDKSEIKACFDAMLQVFDRHILPTFRSRSVPFLLFYLSSLDSSHTDLFLGFLMKRLYHIFDDPMDLKRKGPAGSSVASLLSVVTASYIGSFVSRARFLPDDLVRLTFDMLLTWCLRFLGDLPSHLRSSTKRFKSNSRNAVSERIAVFYAVIQAVMYIFCFRHRILLSNSADVNPSDSKNKYKNYLQPILNSELNPLKWCMKAVVEEFVRLSEHYDMVNCRHIFDRDSRRSAPCLRTEDFDKPDLIQTVSTLSFTLTGAYLGDLDCYFPFDPIILKNCAIFISPEIFIDWCETNDLVSFDEDGEASDDDNDDSDALENDILLAKKKIKLTTVVDSDDARTRTLLECNPAWQKY